MKSLLIFLALCTTVFAQELSVGKVHLGMTKADLRRPVRTDGPLFDIWYYVSQEQMKRLPLADLWEPVYFVQFKNHNIVSVAGRIATVRGKTIEFSDSREKVTLLLGPPDARWVSETLESYSYDARDKKSYLSIQFGKPGLQVSMVYLTRGAR